MAEQIECLSLFLQVLFHYLQPYLEDKHLTDVCSPGSFLGKGIFSKGVFCLLCISIITCVGQNAWLVLVEINPTPED